jgi:hypothetical protein
MHDVTHAWSVAELTGRRFLDLVHPDDLKSTMAAATHMFKGETVVAFENR